MEYQKFINLLDTTSCKVPRFNTEKWIEIHDQSGKSYNINKQIRFKTSMLRSDIRYDRDKHNKSLILKDNAPFVSCVSEINGTLVVNAADLDAVMPVYNLIEYSKNYSKIMELLQRYFS